MRKSAAEILEIARNVCETWSDEEIAIMVALLTMEDKTRKKFYNALRLLAEEIEK